MSRYFMHLRDSTDEILDPEGIEMTRDATASAALMSARDCMAADVKAGRLDLRYRIDVEDGAGKLVRTVAFADAVQIIGPD